MKTKLLLLAILSAGLTPNIQSLAKLDDKKAIVLRQDKNENKALQGAVLIRLKPGYKASNFLNSIQNDKNEIFQSGISLSPMLEESSSYSYDSEKLHSLQNSRKYLNSAKLLESESKVLRTFVLEYDGDEAPNIFIDKLLKNSEAIELAEPYYVYEFQGGPNDPLINQQNQLEQIKALEAWDLGLQGDTNIVIGISDSGVNIAHDDLKGNIAYNYKEIPNNGIDDDGNGYIDDYNGYNFSYASEKKAPDYVYNSIAHGMYVAGLAGATANNGKGISGSGFKCKILPIKIAAEGSRNTSYGYQSIVYAAVRRVSVLNCSWGLDKQPSQIEQDIVDYAINAGVTIVASAGNNTKTNQTSYEIYYPANYQGVLGVGEADQGDIYNDQTMLGPQTDIMAPALGDYTLENDNSSYTKLDWGTSYSSPVASGFVALIRAKYPELSAIQAAEFARMCRDDIKAQNPNYADYVPGRVNMSLAAKLKPMECLGIRPIQYSYINTNGAKLERLPNFGEIFKLKINAFNYLGAGENISFKLKAIGSGKDSISVISAQTAKQNISANSAFVIPEFELKLKGQIEELTMLRVEIYKADTLYDFFIIPFDNSNDLTDFKTEHIAFSVSDYGKFGFSSNSRVRSGLGFAPEKLGNQLYPNGGLAFAANLSDGYSSYLSSAPNHSDFTPVKRFCSPDSNIAILSLTDKKLYDPRLKIKYWTPFKDKSIIRADISISNESDKELKFPACGLFFDWDLGVARTTNQTAFFPEAIPETANIMTSGAQIAWNESEKIYVGAISFTDEKSATAVACGYPSASVSDASSTLQYLTSGSSLQHNTPSDIGFVIGMQFKEAIKKSQSKAFSIIVAYATSKEDLAATLIKAYSTSDVKDSHSNSSSLKMFPNPVRDNLNLVSSDKTFNNIKIYSADGKEILVLDLPEPTNEYELDVSKFNSGVYNIFADGVLLSSFVKL
jgi:subtilisin family serine protease